MMAGRKDAMWLPAARAGRDYSAVTLPTAGAGFTTPALAKSRAEGARCWA